MSLSLFEYQDYRKFLKDWTKDQPKKGYGQFKKLSQALKIHSTMVSHILKERAHLSAEQAIDATQFLGLSDLESDYFLELVHYSRAGTSTLKRRYETRLKALRDRATKLSERFAESQLLSENDKAIFYSSWHFSAIRLLSTINETTITELEAKLRISRNQITEALNFLLNAGICGKTANGKIRATPSRTHLSADSPHVWKHHQSWRLLAIQRHYNLNHSDELIYTAPLTISAQDMPLVRNELIKAIEKIKSIVKNTEPKNVACLNIDWVGVA